MSRGAQASAPTIITLTAIPPRFDRIGPVLASLRAQDLPVQAIELWLPRAYRRFPDWDGVLPEVPAGVTIRRCDTDWGPATKFLPAALERRGQEVDLLVVDDDCAYAPDLHRRFKALRARRPEAVLVAVGRDLADPPPRPRARWPRVLRRSRVLIRADYAALGSRYAAPVALVAASGHADLVEGWGGVLLRPDFLPAAASEGPGAHWAVDDVWLSAMLEAAGVPIWAEATILPPTRQPSGRTAALNNARIAGRDRAALDAAAVAGLRASLGVWLRPARLPLWRRLWRRLPGRWRGRIGRVLGR